MSSPLFPVVLDGFPRCGSTTLARVLSLHPEINCCIEPFHPERHGGEFNRMALRAGTVAPSLDLIKTRWNALKHVWEPGTAWPFKGRQDLNDDLVRCAGTVISIRRRNLLQQIVSSHISKHLHFWIGTRSEFMQHLNAAYLAPLSVAEVSRSLEIASAELAQREQLLSGLTNRQFLVYYEDFFDVGIEQQLTTLQRLFAELGFQPFPDTELALRATSLLNRSIYKWADEEIYDQIPGIRLVDERLGNNSTGRLFSKK